MLALLSGLPILATVLALAFGMRSLPAALLGTAVALAVTLAWFPIPVDQWLPIGLRWGPIFIEVLLIVAGGLLLSEALGQAGAQAELADWIQHRAGHGVPAVLLVVHGITPFAEALTGFAIGIAVGIPLLAQFGLPSRKVAVIGLLGLCAVPWGSMGPGTLIAATMAGVGFGDLGVASAVVSIVPFAVTGVAAAWLAAAPGGRGRAVLLGLSSGLVLTGLIWVMNTAFGTAPAGALGTLVLIALHLLFGRAGRDRTVSRPLGALGRRGLTSYVVLLGGVLLASGLVRFAESPAAWRLVASPSLWLLAATAAFVTGLPRAAGPLSGAWRRRAWTSWRQVAPVAGLFILMGVLMASSGMAAYLARALAGTGDIYLGLAPFVAAMGGFVTGSNSGANAMFASTQAEIARALGVDVLAFMAVHNVCAALMMMASPGKVEMAIRLVPAVTGAGGVTGAAGGDGATGASAADRRWIQRTMIAITFGVVAVLAVANLIVR